VSAASPEAVEGQVMLITAHLHSNGIGGENQRLVVTSGTSSNTRYQLKRIALARTRITSGEV
jgi:hypothetical protein